MNNRLALNGGTPVRDEPISFHRPDLTEEELDGVADSLHSGWVAGPGPEAETFERRLEQRWGVPRVLTTTSCTHALELALLRLNLSPEDEVIVPSFTFVSTASSVIRAGGTPVFADLDPDTLTLTVDTVRPQVTDRTRAVILVHYGGFPHDPADLIDFCSRRDLDLIEDAAQAFDGYVDGQPAGSFGRFGALSFHGSKSLTCGEGGVLVLNDPEDQHACEVIRDKGTDRSASAPTDRERYTWRREGSSYVLSDVLASILNVQLERWPDIKKKRRGIRRRLHRGIEQIDDAGLLRTIDPPEGREDNGHVTAVVCNEDSGGEPLREALVAEGITARRHYEPLHQSPYVREQLGRQVHLPETERISRSILRLPTHTDLDDEDVRDILEGFAKVYRAVLT